MAEMVSDFFFFFEVSPYRILKNSFRVLLTIVISVFKQLYHYLVTLTLSVLIKY